MYMLKAILNEQMGSASGERGAGLAEYAMLLLLITIVTAAVVQGLGDRITAIFQETNVELKNQ